MTKVKLLSITSIFLLALNLVMIWFFVSHKPDGRRDRPKKVIIEKLHFNTSQIEEYEKLIAWHRGNIQHRQHKMQSLKNQLYSTLQEKGKSNATDSLINEIGKVQIEIEQVHYKHFQDIKKLCNPEQQKSFNELCSDIAELFAPHTLPANEK